MPHRSNNEIYDAILVNRQTISQVASRVSSLETLVQGLVSAGVAVSENVTSVKASLGESEDQSSLHSVVEAHGDLILAMQDEISQISGKVGV